MSFLAPKTALPSGLSDNTPGRQATQSPNEVLPLILGRGRAVVQPVTPILKWKFRTTKTSNFAFASFYGWVCLGPIDEAVQLIVNDKPYQGIFERREDNPGTDYIDYTISKETPERFRVWWGLEDAANYTTFLQGLVDPKLVPGMVGKTHPKYRGICGMAVQDIECGRADGGTTPPLPKIELEVYRRSPRAYSFGHVPHGTHLIAAAWDFLTLKRGGMKIAPALLNTDNWDDKIDALYDDGIAGVSGTDLFGNLVVADPREGIDVVGDLMEAIDGHVRERDGKLEVDFMPGDGTTTDPTGLRTISQYEMGTNVDPEEDPDGIDDMPTMVAVTGLDKDANPPMTEASETAMVPFARQQLGEDRPALQLNQPIWCTREQIKASAQLNAARRSVPQWRGTVPVLKQYAFAADDETPLRAGDRFDLDRADIGLDLVVRIIEVSDETATHVVFKVIAERGAFPRPYEPSIDPRADDDAVAPADLERFAAAQLPPDLSDAEDTRVVMLAERASQSTVGFETHFAPTDSWPGQILDAGNTRWAVAAVLQTTMGTGLADVTVNVDTVGDDWDFLASQSTLEQADDRLLMWHGNEWMSVGTITSIGSGVYSLGITRARLASLAVAHAIDDVVFLIFRNDLVSLTHASFADVEDGSGYDETTATKFFKLRPYTGVSGNLTAAFSTALRDPTPDQVTGLAVTINGKVASLTWNKVVGALVDEYQVYREAWDGDSWEDLEMVTEVGANAFTDIVPAYAVLYRWRVRAMATDETEGIYSDYVEATSAAVGAGDVDNTTPDTPNAPTYDSEGTYLGDDGGAIAWVKIVTPALPTGAVYLNVLRRINGDTDWKPVDQRTAGAETLKIGDAVTGVAYQYAVQGQAKFGTLSAVSGVLNRTAPTDTSTPSSPTGLTTRAPDYQDAVPPKYTSDVLGVQPAAIVEFDAPSAKDILFAEYSIQTPYTALPNNAAPLNDAGKLPAHSLEFPIYLDNPSFFSSAVCLRFWDRSGNSSDWVSSGQVNWSAAYAGSVGSQDRADAKLAGRRTGDSESALKIVAEGAVHTSGTLTGGVVEEVVSITLPAGFSTKPSGPDGGKSTASNGLMWRYDWDHVDNTSSSIRIFFYMAGGGNIPSSQTYRIAAMFYQTA